MGRKVTWFILTFRRHVMNTTFSPRIQSFAGSISLWMFEHPQAVKLAILMLPIILALGMALLTSNPLYALPGGGGGSGSGGGTPG